MHSPDRSDETDATVPRGADSGAGSKARPTSPPPADAPTAERHDAVRRANRTETAEDYVEAIAAHIARSGEARVRDLAGTFGVSHVTVSRTVERLRRDGLVHTKPYRPIELTESGLALARHAHRRHAIVLRSLLSLGVPPAAAAEDAEGIEHHVGAETLDALQRHVDSHPLPPALARVAGDLHGSSTDPERFRRVRDAHATELVEDYVEAIADRIAADGEARVRDLAQHFGVSHVTVSRTLGRLQRDGYVVTEPYRPARLTEKGAALAERSRHRHRAVVAFLRALGVPARAAELDAEGVEHHVGPDTLEAFERYAADRPPPPPA